MNTSQQINYFYDCSVILTGYDLVTLYGTDMGTVYLTTLQDILGENMVVDLLNSFDEITHKYRNPANHLLKDTEDVRNAVEAGLLDDEKWGPVCRNIIKMWYMGNWYQLSQEWRETYLTSQLDENKVISKNAYIEGLVWKAMGKHPKSAKQPGYGTWAFTPQ